MDFNKNKALILLFSAALILRLALLILFYDAPLTIVDEQHYNAIAVTILDHGVYGMNEEHPSAMRPPLFPFFLAFVYKITNSHDPNFIRLIQMILSLFSGLFLYRILKSVFGSRAGYLGLLFFLFYPSFLFINNLILSETVFLFLFLLFFYFTSEYLNKGKAVFLMSAGVCLGLTSLTRSITYPMAAPIAVLISLLTLKKYRFRACSNALLFLLFFCITLAPWVTRNYKVFNSFVPVGTMGGLSLYMGNYEHTPLHNAWASVDVTGEKTWYKGHESTLKGLNEAEKQKWAIIEAKDYMKNNLGLTIVRSIVKFANFWGLERTIIAGIERGYFKKFTDSYFRYLIYGIILTVYGVVVLISGGGLCLKLITAPAAFDVIFVFILLAFTGLHSIVFGHSRYHLPLIPVMCGYAGWFIVNMENLKKENRLLFRIVILSVLTLFIVIWGYEIFIGSYDKILSVFG